MNFNQSGALAVLRKIIAGSIAFFVASAFLTSTAFADEPVDLEIMKGSYSEPFIGATEITGNGYWINLRTGSCVNFTSGECVGLVEKILAGNAKDELIQASFFMPNCRAETQNFCLSGLEITTSQGEKLKAEFVKEIAHHDLGTAQGLPVTGAPSIWSTKDPNSGAVSNYLVSLHVRFSLSGRATQFNLEDFYLDVTPVKTGGSSTARWDLQTMGSVVRDGRVVNFVKPADCAYMEPGVCGKIQNFDKEKRIKVSFNSNFSIGTWFDGRLDDPNITTSPLKNGVNEYEVQGTLLEVPQFGAYLSRSNPLWTQVNSEEKCPTCLAHTTQVQALPWQKELDNPLKLIPAAREVAKDKAFAMRKFWRISKTNYVSQRCMTLSPLAGFVTSNAMAYKPGFPAFENNQLRYEVAGLHYMSDGVTPQEGIYNLRILRSLADCLYGLAGQNITASVSVTEENGVKQVAVSTMKEHDGWLDLRVSGFHYSNPTIAVQFKKAIKKTTISCVSSKNKKISKKVTAENPRCPAGYKKK